MMRDDFAVMILTHGRADRVYTLKSLRKGGYTGKVYIVIDNEDDQQDEYVSRYGHFSVTQAAIVQKETQQNAGGMTGVYLDNGTYLKSFYTVMTMPSCVSIAMMGSSHRRIHHNVSWVNCVPMILNQKYRKT